MSEDKTVQVNNDDLNKEIAQLKSEKAAMEIKIRRSGEDLYSEEYLAFLQEQKNKPPSKNSFMSGGKLSDYSEDEIKDLPLPKLVGLMVGEVYGQLKLEEQKKMTINEAKEHKKRVANARAEIKTFAADHPDFWNYAARIDELAQDNPKLNAKQLYVLAGGKIATPPNTRATVEAGVKQSDKNLSRREIIQQEYQKLK